MSRTPILDAVRAMHAAEDALTCVDCMAPATTRSDSDEPLCAACRVTRLNHGHFSPCEEQS